MEVAGVGVRGASVCNPRSWESLNKTEEDRLGALGWGRGVSVGRVPS